MTSRAGERLAAPEAPIGAEAPAGPGGKRSPAGRSVAFFTTIAMVQLTWLAVLGYVLHHMFRG